MSTSIGHEPQENWTFDESVTECFEDMLRRSIPDYKNMRRLVHSLCINQIRPESRVIDLGCSKGGAIASLIIACPSSVDFLAIDNSEPMLSAIAQEFVQFDNFAAQKMDLRYQFPASPLKPVSLIISNLTIQFIPIEYRQNILAWINEALMPGGAFVFVEKILGESSQSNDLLVQHYDQLKEDHGYSQDDIIRKKLSLEGVLVPVTSKWNEELLSNAGFKNVTKFWQFLNFAGWIAFKG